EAAREGKLLFKRCKQCAHVQFPPRYLCPQCWSDQSEWIESAGRGRVHSFSIVHRAATPAFADKVPYVLAMIELDDGPRMITNIVGEGALDVAIGEPVAVVFEARPGGALPQFRRLLKGA